MADEISIPLFNFNFMILKAHAGILNADPTGTKVHHATIL
jgi:hypothetical protein